MILRRMMVLLMICAFGFAEEPPQPLPTPLELPNKPPLPGEKNSPGKELGENKAINSFTIVPIFIESCRKFDFKKGLAPHTLKLSVSVEYPRNLNVVSTSGYVVEEVISDSGETIKSDWQWTVGVESTVYDWEDQHRLTEPANSKESNKPPERIAPVSYGITLGNPENPVNSLKRIKGFFSFKIAEKTKQIEVPVGEWEEKLLTFPELKDIGIHYKRQGNILSVYYTIVTRELARLKGIEVFDATGKKINWGCAGRKCTDKDTLKCDLILYGHLPDDGKIVFHLFDNIKDERIPFLFENLTLEAFEFENGGKGPGVKPPRPPEDTKQPQKTKDGDF